MKKQEFLDLTGKYLAGTLTRQEELRFLEACEILQNRTMEWDAAEMDDMPTVKTRIFDRIVEDIHPEEIEKVRMPNSRLWRYMAAACIALLCAFALYTFWTSLQSRFFPAQMLTITSGKGKVLKKQLPDGSTVWLNSGSTLTYPEYFFDSARYILLIGEAYFEVVHKEKQPFIIHTQNLDTKVLGTHFLVKAYPSDAQSKVTLLSGRVSVSGANVKGQTVLAPLQELTIDNASGQFKIRTNIDSTSSMAWASGKLSFRKNTLSEVIGDLERRFNTKINAENHLKDCLIYADVLPGDTLESVLDQLAISLEGKIIKYKNNEYRISGKGCQ